MRYDILKSICIVGVLATIVACSIDEYEDHDESKTNTYTKEKFLTTEKASQANKALMSLITNQGKSRSTTVEEHVYPSYFGGSYADNDGKLIALITKDSFYVKSMELMNSLDNEDIEYQSCNYSLTYLQQVINKLDAYKRTHWGENVSDNFTAYGIDIAKNRVFVILTNYSTEKMEQFKDNVMNSPVIVFYDGKGSPTVKTSTTVKPGGKFYVGTSSTFGSIGYRASKYGNGFVTAGHVISVGEKAMLKKQSTEIGSCGLSQDDEDLDAAFVYTNALVDMSNVFENYSGAVFSAETYDPIYGETLNMGGCVTGLTSGLVTGIDVTITNNETGTITKGCYQVQCASKKGDSGGIVYVVTSDYKYIPVGIIISSDLTTYSYIVLASKINNKFGLTMY